MKLSVINSIVDLIVMIEEIWTKLNEGFKILTKRDMRHKI